MAHRGVFDPTDHDVFNEQRQRFDWNLLQNGNVHRYETAFQLDSACTRLTDLGYLVHHIDGKSWTTVADMHTAFAKAMSFPAYYGRNLDALNDALSDVARFDYGSEPASSGTVLAIAGYDTLAEIDRRTAAAVLDIFAVQAHLAALYAHPMMRLVESTITDFPAVGGRSVSVGSFWDVEPDPPAPFHDEDIVENVFQVYADEDSASQYVAALHSVLANTLTDLGRWQILDPVLASERTAAFLTEHRQESPPPGNRLWEIFIGLRGVGDCTILGDQLAHILSDVLSDVGMQFDQLITRFYAAGTEERGQALNHYTNLRNPDEQ
ncbi:barstar family protein [Rhodococcus globerulus]|uniref:Barstar family protein n=1 Tax=Rhodococcus globerulus TaxID=33008 RepID=A0ABU4C4S7_RHOGO|nr:barstar family protein [Rhodococcus globerulus]MDV6271512.1 barstar family protein [Rhodococcus globerulus]